MPLIYCNHVTLSLCTVDPPNTAALGNGENTAVLETAVKGVIYNYNQEKNIRDLKISGIGERRSTERQYWGRLLREGRYWGTVPTTPGRRPHLTVFGNDYETKDGTGVRDYIHVRYYT